MKAPLCLVLIGCLVACGNKVIPGKYVYPNAGIITINDSGNYTFRHVGEDFNMQSKGKALLKGKEVSFIPDSSYFFRLTVSDYYYDTSLKRKKKILLDNTNNGLSKFNFYFLDRDRNQIDFDESYISVYDDKKHILNQLVLCAKLKDSVVYWPRPYHSSLYSNSVVFEDVNANDPTDKPWNVLLLGVEINVQMFSFVTLDNYILKKHTLVKKNWPVYKLVR